MKVLNFSRACIVIICALVFFESCKKEDLTKQLVGSYTGTATVGYYPNVTTLVTYPQCKIVISRFDRKKIRMVITVDPADPGSQRQYEEPVIDDFNFHGSHGGSRQPTTEVKGILQGNQLAVDVETIYSSGPLYEFHFSGHRD